MNKSQQYDIFISYRREGGYDTAQLLYDRLTQMGYRVSFDLETLRGGKFNTQLYRRIEQCSDVLVVMSRDSLNLRENQEDDWFRLEIAHALKHKKNIVPVFLRDFKFPQKGDLPSDIYDLVDFQGVTPVFLRDFTFPQKGDLPSDISNLVDFQGVTASQEHFDNVLKWICNRLIAKPQPYYGKIRGLVAAIRAWVAPHKAIGGMTQDEDRPVVKHRIGNSEVKVLVGDICKSKCEVIVSSDDSRLSQGGGVSYMIASAGGDDIQRHIKNLVPVDLGDVAVTTAGNLQQKYIFHAVTIDLEKSRIIDEALHDFIVRDSVRRCFQLVSMLKLSSIAFPVIGAGTARIPVERACRRMAEMFVEELGKTNRGLSIELWLFDEAMDIADSILDDVVKSGTKYVGQPFSMPMDNKQNVSETQSSTSVMSHGPYSECPDDGSSREVFVCYSRKDAKMSDWVCGVLRSAGITYWRDVDGIYSGQNFKGVIVRAIRASHTVFFLSSKSSNASENVIGEVGAALHFGKHVVPIKLDATEYHDNLLLDMLNLDNIDVVYLGMERAADKMCKVALLNRANSGVRENLQD